LTEYNNQHGKISDSSTQQHLIRLEHSIQELKSIQLAVYNEVKDSNLNQAKLSKDVRDVSMKQTELLQEVQSDHEEFRGWATFINQLQRNELKRQQNVEKKIEFLVSKMA